MDTAEDRQKTLDRLVFIGIGVCCVSVILTYLLAPPISATPGVLALIRSLTAAYLVASVFILWQIRERKNWARRLELAVFFYGLPAIPAMFAASAYAGFGAHQAMVRYLGVIGLLYGLVLTIFLFRPDIRSMYDATPANPSRQIGYAALAFGIGLSGTMFSNWSRRYTQEHLSTRSQGPQPAVSSSLSLAQVYAGMPLPNWGEVGYTEMFYPSENAPAAASTTGQTMKAATTVLKAALDLGSKSPGFSVVPYKSPQGNLSVLLWISQPGFKGGLDNMLSIMDNDSYHARRAEMKAWSREFISGIGNWRELLPSKNAAAGSSVLSRKLGARAFTFPHEPATRAEAIAYPHAGRVIAAIAYQRGGFDDATFDEFLKALLAVAPPDNS